MNLPSSLIEEVVQRGQILHGEYFTDIAHGKFFVVMGVRGDKIAGFFFINSRIHPATFNKQELLNLQYPLKKKDYNFLEYDSFLHASYLRKMAVSRIVQGLNNGEITIISRIKEHHMQEILIALHESEIYSKKDKIDFFGMPAE